MKRKTHIIYTYIILLLLYSCTNNYIVRGEHFLKSGLVISAGNQLLPYANKSKDGKLFFLLGEVFLNTGSFERALFYFKKAYKYGYEKALYYITKLDFRYGAYNSMYEYISYLKNSLPMTGKILEQDIEKKLKARNLSKAIKRLIMSKDNTDIERLKKLAMKLHKMGYIYLALKLYKSIIKIKPDEWIVSNIIAQIYFSTNQPESAIKYLLNTIKYKKDNLYALRNIGKYYYDKNNLIKALKYFAKAVRYHKSNAPECYMFLGFVHYKFGNLELAKKKLEKAVSLGIKNSEVFTILGIIDSALNPDREEESKYFHLARKYKKYKLNTIAIKRYSYEFKINRLIDISGLFEYSSTKPLFYLHYAIALYNSKQYNDSLDMLKEIEKIPPVSYKIYLWKAKCYSKLGMYRLAINNLKIALKKGGEKPQIYIEMANIYKSKEFKDERLFIKNIKKAIKVSKKTSKSNKIFRYYMKLINYYTKSNKWEEANKTIKEAQHYGKIEETLHSKVSNMLKLQSYIKEYRENPDRYYIIPHIIDIYSKEVGYDDTLLQWINKLMDTAPYEPYCTTSIGNFYLERFLSGYEMKYIKKAISILKDSLKKDIKTPDIYYLIAQLYNIALINLNETVNFLKQYKENAFDYNILSIQNEIEFVRENFIMYSIHLFQNARIIYEKTGTIDALKRIAKIIKRDDCPIEAITYLAYQYSKMGKYKKAIELYKLALKKDKSNYENYLHLGSSMVKYISQMPPDIEYIKSRVKESKLSDYINLSEDISKNLKKTKEEAIKSLRKYLQFAYTYFFRTTINNLIEDIRKIPISKNAILARIASLHLKNRDTNLAMQIYKYLLKNSSLHDLIIPGIIECYEMMGYSKEKIKEFIDEYVNQHKRRSITRFAGIYCFKNGFYKKAISYIKTLPYKNDIKLLKYLGYSYYHLGKWKEAKKYFIKVIKQVSLDESGIMKIREGDFYYYYGITLYKLKDTQKAIGIFENAISYLKADLTKLYSNRKKRLMLINSYIYLAIIKLNMLKFSGAINTLKEASIFDLKNEGHFNFILGKLYLAMGDMERARLSFEREYEKCPDNAQNIAFYAYTLYKSFRYAKAIAILKKLKIMNKAIFDSIGAITYINCLFKTGKQEEAKNILNKYIKTKPKSFIFYKRLAKWHIENGRYKKAINIMLKATKSIKDSDYPLIYLAYNLLYYFDDKIENAMHYLNKAVEHKRLNAIRDYILILMEKGDINSAYCIYDYIKNKNIIDKGTTPFDEASILFKKGKINDMIKLLDIGEIK